jgi:hypothetical protein
MVSRIRVHQFSSNRLAGVVLILSGLAVGAYSMPSDSEPSLSALQTVIGSSAEVSRQAGQQLRSAGSLPVSRSVLSAPGAEQALTPVVVTLKQREPSPVPSIAAPIPVGREALARELQSELRRVGCFDAEINGQWTPATRRAMKAFIDRVNAALPVGEPDPVLLVMVRGHEDQVCARSCPPGQGEAEDGRCLPSAILAKAARTTPWPVAARLPKAQSALVAQRTSAVIQSAGVIPAAPASQPAVAAAPAAPQMPTAGRMGLAGPMAEPKLPAASDVPPVARHVRSRHATRARPPRYASAPRRSTFARVVFRRVDSAF